MSTDQIIRGCSRATSGISLHPRRRPWGPSNKASTRQIFITRRRTMMVPRPTMIRPYCTFTIPHLFLVSFTSPTDAADSSVPGSLMSGKRRSSLRVPPDGGRSTMWGTCMQHSTWKKWSRRRGSILGGLAGEIKYYMKSRPQVPQYTKNHRQLGIPVYVYRLASLEPLSTEIFAVKPERRYQRMYVHCFRAVFHVYQRLVP